jgi:hypothetical protein
MTITTPGKVNGRNGSAPAGSFTAGDARPIPPAVAPRSRRRPGLLLLGFALVAVGGLATAWVVAQAGNRTAVVVTARDLQFGQVVTASDLTTAEISLDPSVAIVPAAQRDGLVGQVATASLPAGAIVSPGSFAADGPPTDGESLVGLALPTGRLPAEPLEAGDVVLVVPTPAQGAEPPLTAPESVEANVVRLTEPDMNGVSVLDVTVSERDGPTLAAWSATGRIAVVLQPPGEG